VSDFYSVEAKTLKFDKEMIVDFYNTIDQTKWVHRQDKLPQYWPIDENNTFDRTHEFYKQLQQNINVDIDEDRIYFSRVHPGGIPNHWDFENFTKLQFPVICDEPDDDWSKTPILFIDQFDQIVERVEHTNNTPIIYSANYMHGTAKSLKNKNDRITLVVDIKFWFERVKIKYYEGTLFTNNKAFWSMA
jgi:hypothetical protein|tara:strand:+ start:632 stop:1198 length:567 start_codon:yes stop_codon:yes gene_type:complete